MTRFTLVPVVLAMVLVAAVPSAAQAQGSGTLTGVLRNGTAGAAPPADVEVVVHVLQNRAKTGEHRVRTDASGQFQLGGLTTGPETIYFPIVEYRGVAYYPERPVVLDGAGAAHAEITVYESTPRPDAVSFERLNMLVMGVSPTALTIMEMGAVVNGGDRTFAADPEATGSARTVRFLLPPGAIQVTPQAGLSADTLEAIPDGFATTDPIRPGRREVAFSYQLPYSTATLDLARSFALPVGTFTLYVPGDVGEVIGPGLIPLGTAELGGRQYRQYAIQQVAPGAEVRFRLGGLPAPFFASPRELGVAVIGMVAVVLGAAVVVALSRRRGRATAPASAGATPTAAVSTAQAAERQALVRALALLDDRYATGGIDDATYRAERAAQKARLVELTRSSAGA